MNVKKVTEKITEWQVAAQNMKSSLSDGDEVYESWIKQMEAFMKDFPLLQQLSMDALKVRRLDSILSIVFTRIISVWRVRFSNFLSLYAVRYLVYCI